jgi:retron-type reverse transcriptase
MEAQVKANPAPSLPEAEKKIVPYSNFKLSEIFGQPLDKVDSLIKDIAMHVRNIEIPKKDGTKRKITAPDSALKYIQKTIYWRIFKRYKPNGCVHGFISKRGIVTNARMHVGAKSLGKIDIKSFFDTISEKHLKNSLFGNKHVCRYCKHYENMLEDKCNPSLYKNKNTNYPHKCEEIKAVHIPGYCEKTGYQSLIARIIKLCTINGVTAQGFPTSPILANIVLRGFDETMETYCKENSITYSRYADDLCFSSKVHDKRELKHLVQTKANRLLWAYGFEPNKEKTNWKSNAGRLLVCGVVVNKKTSVEKKTVNRFRSAVHHATVIDAKNTTRSEIRKLKGFASYLMSIDHKRGELYMQKLNRFSRGMAADSDI